MSNGAEPFAITSSVHSQALALELDWLAAVLQLRLEQHFHQHAEGFEAAPAPPELPADSALACIICEHGLDAAERLVLALALAPHLRPEVLDLLFVRNQNLDRGFTEFGGWKGQRHGGFLPTGETAAFLLAGADLTRRIALLAQFDPQHPFSRRGILKLDADADAEPQLAGALQLSAEALQRLSTGVWHKPDYNARFPAKLITTALAWDDLVLAPDVFEEIDAIQVWLRHGPALMHGLGEVGQARLPQPVLRPARHRQNADRNLARQGRERRCLSHRSVDDRVEIHRRNREESGARVRSSAEPRMGVVFR